MPPSDFMTMSDDKVTIVVVDQKTARTVGMRAPS